MEFRYAKMPGCLMVVLGLCTLGVANWIIHRKSRRWPALGDEGGLVLRDGTRIPWAAFSGAQEVVTEVGGAAVRRLDLYSSEGVVEFPFERVERAQQAVDYLLDRVSGVGEPEPEPQPIRPPQPGPPGTQTFFCGSCGYTWGPVGVKPYVADAPEHQLFLVCGGCRTPQAHTTALAPADLDCVACGAARLGNLDACPGCASAEARWV